MRLFEGVLLLLLSLVVTTADAPNRAKSPVSRAVKTKIVPKFYNIQHCTHKTHSLIIKNYSIILDKSGAEFVDADWELTATATRISGLKITFHRCPIGVGSQCEYFRTVSFNVPMCDLLLAEKRIWTPLVKTAQPPLKCPLRKGSYIHRNATANFDSIEKMVKAGLNVDQFSWPSEVQLDSENGLFACFKFQAELKHIRIRGNA